MPAPWPLDEWDLDTPGHGPLPHGSGFCSLALGRDVNALPPLLPLLVPPAMSDLKGPPRGMMVSRAEGRWPRQSALSWLCRTSAVWSGPQNVPSLSCTYGMLSGLGVPPTQPPAVSAPRLVSAVSACVTGGSELVLIRQATVKTDGPT